MHQEAYIDRILNRFTRLNENPPINENIGIPIPIGTKLEPLDGKATLEVIKDYQQQIGSLMYLPTKTRPDLAYPIGLLARFMSNPGPQHEKVLKRL